MVEAKLELLLLSFRSAVERTCRLSNTTNESKKTCKCFERDLMMTSIFCSFFFPRSSKERSFNGQGFLMIFIVVRDGFLRSFLFFRDSTTRNSIDGNSWKRTSFLLVLLKTRWKYSTRHETFSVKQNPTRNDENLRRAIFLFGRLHNRTVLIRLFINGCFHCLHRTNSFLIEQTSNVSHQKDRTLPKFVVSIDCQLVDQVNPRFCFVLFHFNEKICWLNFADRTFVSINLDRSAKRNVESRFWSTRDERSFFSMFYWASNENLR